MNKFLTYVFFVVLLGFFGCSSPKNIPYFNNLPDTVDTVVNSTDFLDPKIQADDILDISIQTTEPQASISVNQESAKANIGNQKVSGFLVDKNGEVEMPILGTIKLEGLTTYDARERIRKIASKYYVNPSVQVRFANFKITVLGEVSKPAIYTVPNEKVTILDAIGLAGDLTIYGMRENVLIVREEGGDRKMARLDLSKSDLFKSKYFYLRQNDVVYVEPNKAKVATTDAAKTRNIAIVSSFLSVIVVVISRLL